MCGMCITYLSLGNTPYSAPFMVAPANREKQMQNCGSIESRKSLGLLLQNPLYYHQCVQHKSKTYPHTNCYEENQL